MTYRVCSAIYVAHFGKRSVLDQTVYSPQSSSVPPLLPSSILATRSRVGSGAAHHYYCYCTSKFLEALCLGDRQMNSYNTTTRGGKFPVSYVTWFFSVACASILVAVGVQALSRSNLDSATLESAEVMAIGSCFSYAFTIFGILFLSRITVIDAANYIRIVHVSIFFFCGFYMIGGGFFAKRGCEDCDTLFLPNKTVLFLFGTATSLSFLIILRCAQSAEGDEERASLVNKGLRMLPERPSSPRSTTGILSSLSSSSSSSSRPVSAAYSVSHPSSSSESPSNSPPSSPSNNSPPKPLVGILKRPSKSASNELFASITTSLQMAHVDPVAHVVEINDGKV